MDSEQLLNRQENEARLLCELTGYQMRVVVRDDMPMVGTCDYRQDRINVIIKDNKVHSVRGIG